MHNLNQYAPRVDNQYARRVDNQYVPSSYKQSQELKTNFSKIILSIALLIAPLSARSLAQDYNGNLISKNKIILNSKSSNSYIQSLTTHTINFDGLLDQTFGNNPTNDAATPLGTTFLPFKIAGGGTDQCNSIAIQSDGKIVMGGKSGIAGNTHFSAARLLSNGQLDSSFGGYNSQAGTMYINQHITPDDSDDNCNSIAIQSDGKIVMGGYASSYQNTHWRFAAARLLSNGQLDSSFGNNTSGPIGTMYIAQSITNDTYSRDDQCKSIALQSDGKIVMGGSSFNNFALAQLINPMTLQTYQPSYAKVGAGLYV